MKPAAWLWLFALLLVLGSAQAQQAKLPGRVAFVTPRGQLATIAPDGSAKRILTQAGLRYQFPAWSPVAATVAAIGSDPGGGGVFIIEDSAEANAETLYQNLYGGPIYLYWSPDGSRLGFLSNVLGGLGLNIVPTDTGMDEPDTRQLAVGNPLYWQWSEDSERLLVHNGNNAPAGEVAFYETSGEIGETLGEPGRFNAPGLSPDERYLAYAALEATVSKVVVQGNHQETAGIRREVPYQGLASFSWSPAANKLAIMRPRDNAQQPFGPIGILDAENGELTPLTASQALAFFWSPDGRYLAYFTTYRSGGGEMATVSSRIYQHVQQNPFLLELRVADVATGENRLLTTFTPTPTFMDQFLPFFDQYALSHALWSPDSRALVLPVQGRSGPEVVVVTLSGEALSLTAGEMPFWSRQTE